MAAFLSWCEGIGRRERVGPQGVVSRAVAECEEELVPRPAHDGYHSAIPDVCGLPRHTLRFNGYSRMTAYSYSALVQVSICDGPELADSRRAIVYRNVSF